MTWFIIKLLENSLDQSAVLMMSSTVTIYIAALVAAATLVE